MSDIEEYVKSHIPKWCSDCDFYGFSQVHQCEPPGVWSKGEICIWLRTILRKAEIFDNLQIKEATPVEG